MTVMSHLLNKKLRAGEGETDVRKLAGSFCGICTAQALLLLSAMSEGDGANLLTKDSISVQEALYHRHEKDTEI